MVTQSQNTAIPPSWNEINTLINKMSPVKENNTDTIIKELNNILQRMTLVVDSDEKQFAKCYRKLNFKLNLLKQVDTTHDLKNLDQRMLKLAKEHHIVRDTPAIGKFRRAVGYVRDMVSNTVEEGASGTRKSKILSEEYWKEFLDKWHRHPKILDKAFNNWKVYGFNEKMDFWEYLKLQENSGLFSQNELEEASGVVYLNSEERAKFRSSIQMDGDKVICKGANGSTLPDGFYITVLGPDHQYYLAGKQEGKFQHASFFAGKSVITAGKFLIEKGVLKHFISESGHYKPEKLEIFKALKDLESKGIDISKIQVVYGAGDDKTIIENPKTWSEYQSFLKEGMPIFPKLTPEADLEDHPQMFEVDRKAARLANDRFGGGVYNRKIEAVIPCDGMAAHVEWVQAKNRIAREIGIIPSPSLDNYLWQNSATSVRELLHDAQALSKDFHDKCEDIAASAHSVANFGPKDACFLKSEASLERKVNQDSKFLGISKQQALSKIGDALRGTIYTDNPKKVQKIVEGVIEYANEKQGKVVFKNIWAEERESGYVGLHAKIYLPVPSSEGEKAKYLIVELQIHLESIMNGSELCPKEREHLIYEKVRTGSFNPLDVSSASKLIMLAAMRNAIDFMEEQDKVAKGV